MSFVYDSLLILQQQLLGFVYEVAIQQVAIGNMIIISMIIIFVWIKNRSTKKINYWSKYLQENQENVSQNKKKVIQNKIKQHFIKIKQNTKDLETKIKPLAEKGADLNELKQISTKMQKYQLEEIASGKISGHYFVKNQKYLQNSQQFTKQLLFHNPLHVDLFKTAMQFEGQVLQIIGKMLKLKQHNGSLTTGIPQNAMNVVFAYKNLSIKKGIINPNMLTIIISVVPETGHPCYKKACHYFSIQYRQIPLKNYTPNLSIMKTLIDKNTICVITSIPQTVYGLIDPIQEIKRFSTAPIHIDSSLHFFLIYFVQRQLIAFDKNVLSIGVDLSGYGRSLNQVGCLMYKQKHCQFYACLDWPGGLYATVGMQGSRSGIPAGSAWYAITQTGSKQYKRLADMIVKQTKQFVQDLKKVKYIEVIGQPRYGTISFVSQIYDLRGVLGGMYEKGWQLQLLRNPTAIQIKVRKQFIQDLYQSFKNTSQPPVVCFQHLTLQGPAKTIGQEYLKQYYEL